MKVFFLLFTFATICFSISTHSIKKRQSDDRFFLFGEVVSSLFKLFSTAVTEGGKFVSKQVEANQPVMRTVGNISTAIAQSDFGNSVHNSVRGGGDVVIRGAECALCSLQPDQASRRKCNKNCLGSP